MAKAIVWAMVTTHPQWLGPSETVVVPYESIGKALKLDPRIVEGIWTLARKTPEMLKVAKTFEAAYPPVGVPQPGVWPGGACGLVVDFVQLLDPLADPAIFPSVDILPAAQRIRAKKK